MCIYNNKEERPLLLLLLNYILSGLCLSFNHVFRGVIHSLPCVWLAKVNVAEYLPGVNDISKCYS